MLRDFIQIVVLPFTFLIVFFVVIFPPAVIILYWWLNICLAVAHYVGIL